MPCKADQDDLGKENLSWPRNSFLFQLSSFQLWQSGMQKEGFFFLKVIVALKVPTSASYLDSYPRHRHVLQQLQTSLLCVSGSLNYSCGVVVPVWCEPGSFHTTGIVVVAADFNRHFFLGMRNPSVFLPQKTLGNFPVLSWLSIRVLLLLFV